MIKYTTRLNSQITQGGIRHFFLEIEQHIDPDQGSCTRLIGKLERRTLITIRQNLVDQNSFLGSGDEDA